MNDTTKNDDVKRWLDHHHDCSCGRCTFCSAKELLGSSAAAEKEDPSPPVTWLRLSTEEGTAYLIRNKAGGYLSRRDPATPGALRDSRNPPSMAQRYDKTSAESVVAYLKDHDWDQPATDDDLEVVEVRIVEVIEEAQR